MFSREKHVKYALSFTHSLYLPNCVVPHYPLIFNTVQFISLPISVSAYQLAHSEQYSWWRTGLAFYGGPAHKTLGMVTCSPAFVSCCHMQRIFPTLRITLKQPLRNMVVPRHVGTPVRLIIRGPLKPIFLKLFRFRSGETSWGCVPKLRIVFAECVRVWKPEFTVTIFQIIAVTSYRPL
jgi:hypothetical protein